MTADQHWLRRVGKDNPWIVPVVGVLGTALTFALAGVVWGLVGAVVFLLVAVLALVNSMRQMQKEKGSQGDADASEEIAAESPESPRPESVVSEGEAAPRDSTEAADNVSDGAPPERTMEPEADSEMAAFQALAEGRLFEARRRFQEWVDEAADDETRVKRKGSTLRMLASSDAPWAIDELRDVVELHPSMGDPLTSLAWSLSDQGEHAEAISVLSKGLPEVRAEDTATATNVLARIFLLAGEFGSALEAAEKVLADPGAKRGERVFALLSKAQALEGVGRRFESFAAFEEYLGEKPGETNTRYRLAFAYGELGFRDLAIVHYQTVLEHTGSSMWSSPRNNLGVQFHHRGLGFRASEMFREAADRGSQLAAANLAYRYINAGLGEDAKALVERAQEMKETHKNLAEATARFQGIEEEERTRLEEIEQRGRKARDLVRAFGDNTSAELPTGAWDFSTGDRLWFSEDGIGRDEGEIVEVELEFDGEVFTVAWNEVGGMSEGVAVRVGERLVGILKEPLVDGSVGFSAIPAPLDTSQPDNG